MWGILYARVFCPRGATRARPPRGRAGGRPRRGGAADALARAGGDFAHANANGLGRNILFRLRGRGRKQEREEREREAVTTRRGAGLAGRMAAAARLEAARSLARAVAAAPSVVSRGTACLLSEGWHPCLPLPAHPSPSASPRGEQPRRGRPVVADPLAAAVVPGLQRARGAALWLTR